MKVEKVIQLAIDMVGMRPMALFEIDGFNRIGLVGGPIGWRIRSSSGTFWAFALKERINSVAKTRGTVATRRSI
jgi:hypothetical protein